MNHRRILLGLVAPLVAAPGGLIYVRYRRDMGRARRRLAKGDSKVIATACGPIEYAVAGKGAPVLVVHGAGGGFDQGMNFAEPLVNAGFQVIAMSRFGYLRTPMPSDASPAAQADAHACLLDALAIKQAAVIGASAGAPSSMQLALRYPERVKRLVLLVPAAYVPRPDDAPSLKTPPGGRFLFNTALKSDFLFWLAPKIARDVVVRGILATQPEVLKKASTEEQVRAKKVIEHILPITQRRLGLINDGAITSSLERYPLEHIGTPTLVISCADDLFGTFESARYIAQHVPNARFIGYETGGHLWVGHQHEIVAEIADFLK